MTVDPDIQLQVLREELAYVYAQNYSLNVRLRQLEASSVTPAEFIESINPEWLEDKLCANIGLGGKTGEVCLEILREVAHAESGERTS